MKQGASSGTPAVENSGQGSESKAPATLDRIEVAQTDSERRSILHWSNGQSRELWSLSKMDLLVTEDPNGRTFVSRNPMLFGDPFSPADFAWINRESRVGEKTVPMSGSDCIHYKGLLVLPLQPGQTKAATIPCEAWIDAKTSFPVALLKGDLLGKFSFGAPPENLAMPEKFRKRLDYYKLTMGMTPEKNR